MSGFTYRVVPFEGKIKGSGSAGEVSTQLQTTINAVATDGWEFVSIADVGIEVSPGCLGGLLGKGTNYTRYDQLVFRRPAS